MTGSRVLKWITGAFEIFLGIPVLGGAIIISTLYIPLLVMLILHIVTLILSAQNNEPKYGSIVGIVTSLVAWIPVLGMIMHIISGILLTVSAAQKSSYPRQPSQPF